VQLQVNLIQAYETFDYEVYFGKGGAQHTRSAHNTVQARDTGRSEDDTLAFYFKRNTSEEPPNIGMRDFTRAGVSSMNFSGPILVVREGSRFGPQGVIEECRDLYMRDVRNAADYLSSAWRYGYRGELNCDVRVLASLILCPKDLGEHSLRTKWSEQAVNGRDTIFQSEGSGIANLLGIPLSLRLEDPYGMYGEERDDSYYNSAAELLMRDITLTTTGPQRDARHMRSFRWDDRAYAGTHGFGSSPKRWSSNTTGSVWVARADGLPLLTCHLEAICSYISTKVEPRLSRCIPGLGPGESVSQREWVLNSITKADFMEFFNDLRASREATDPAWRYFPSPYDLTPDVVDEMRPKIEELWEMQKPYLAGASTAH
jgi:hypothetical protein